jgi:hypothetical protein
MLKKKRERINVSSSVGKGRFSFSRRSGMKRKGVYERMREINSLLPATGQKILDLSVSVKIVFVKIGTKQEVTCS